MVPAMCYLGSDIEMWQGSCIPMDGEDNSKPDMAIGIERERERSTASGCFGNSEQIPQVFCKVEQLPLTSVDERKTSTSKR